MAETEQMTVLLRKAVMLRLQGMMWADVAVACERAEGTCSNWPIQHRDEWNDLWTELAPTIEDDARQFAQRALRRQEKLAENADEASEARQANSSIMGFGSKAITQKSDVTQHGDLTVDFGKEPGKSEGSDE